MANSWLEVILKARRAYRIRTVAIAAFVFVLGVVVALTTLGSPFSTTEKSKAAMSRLIGFAADEVAAAGAST